MQEMTLEEWEALQVEEQSSQTSNKMTAVHRMNTSLEMVLCRK